MWEGDFNNCLPCPEKQQIRALMPGSVPYPYQDIQLRQYLLDYPHHLSPFLNNNFPAFYRCPQNLKGGVADFEVSLRI